MNDILFYRFRPQTTKKAYVLSDRRDGQVVNYNWRAVRKNIVDTRSINRQTIDKVFSQLHYLACHAPVNINNKWKPAYDKFLVRHCGNFSRGSYRWLSQYTADSWL